MGEICMRLHFYGDKLYLLLFVHTLFLPNPNFTLFRWDAIFFLIIPLVFLAWQYSMKEVVMYTSASVFIEKKCRACFGQPAIGLVTVGHQRPPKLSPSSATNYSQFHPPTILGIWRFWPIRWEVLREAAFL